MQLVVSMDRGFISRSSEHNTHVGMKFHVPLVLPYGKFLQVLRIPEFLRAKPLKFDLLHHKMVFFCSSGIIT